jgi:hypothetical protein
MHRKYVLKTFAIFCCSLVIVYSGFLGSHYFQDKKAVSTTTLDDKTAKPRKIDFIRPEYNPVENKHLTRVEIEVRDDLTTPDGKVLSVIFNDDHLVLRPADNIGKRGSTFLQLRPGIYNISWTVKNNPYAELRETQQTMQIKVLPSDLWIHIYILGKKIKIS